HTCHFPYTRVFPRSPPPAISPPSVLAPTLFSVFNQQPSSPPSLCGFSALYVHCLLRSVEEEGIELLSYLVLQELRPQKVRYQCAVTKISRYLCLLSSNLRTNV
ncbi:hypothetical protein M8C21_010096, partial [Ambrosia artemisiifolia]